MNEHENDEVMDDITGEEEFEETEEGEQEEEEDESSASDDKYKLLQAQFTKVTQELAEIKRQQSPAKQEAEPEDDEDEDSVLAEYGLDDATPNEAILARAIAGQKNAIRQLIGLIKPMYNAYEGDREASEAATKFTGLLNRTVSAAEARTALDKAGGDAVAAFAELSKPKAPQRDKPRAAPGSVRPSQGKPMTPDEIVEYAAKKAGLR